MSAADVWPLPAPREVIPHQGDALLIDRIVAMDEHRLCACLTVRGGTAFSDAHDELPAWVAPEIMAQAVAAYAGCRSLLELGTASAIGLLLGVRKLELQIDAFRPGDDVVVEVLCTSRDEAGRGVFDCAISTCTGLAATATLTVFQPQDPPALQALLAAG